MKVRHFENLTLNDEFKVDLYARVLVNSHTDLGDEREVIMSLTRFFPAKQVSHYMDRAIERARIITAKEATYEF